MSNKSLSLHDLNALLTLNNARWQAKENFPDDLKGKNLGYTPGPNEPSLRQRENIGIANVAKTKSDGKGAVSFPTSFDWRSGNYITSIKDQGGCGSCVAFSTIAAMEGMYQIIKNNPDSGIDLSEAQLWYCYAASYGITCETAWWPGPTLDCLKQGIADEACFPYVAGDQDCSGLCSDWADRAKKISGWHEITDVNQMKEWLSTKGPLVSVFIMYEDFYYYASGIYHYVSGDVIGGDSICVVGYSEDEGGYWICKQQWSSKWGEDGYFRIGYGQCGIDTTMWAIDGIVDTGWISNKLILGLWAIDQDRNAWAYVDGEAWKRIAYDNDNIFYNILGQLISAKASGKTVSLYITDGVITQIYVNT